MNTRKSIVNPLMLVCACLLGVGTSQAEESAKVTVTVKPLSMLLAYPERSAPATVVSLNHSQISAELAARIEQIYVRVGDRVKKGAKLARLDCRDQKLALDAARSRFRLAQKELDRAVTLRQSSNIAEQNYAQAETEMEQAKIVRQQQQVLVGRCLITAPFQGVVTARIAATGGLAAPGTPLVELLDIEHLEVSSRVPRHELVTLREARSLDFREGKTVFPLSLRAITPLIDSQAQNQEVRLTFKQKASLPGATGRLVWALRQPHIAANFLSQRGQKIGVFIAKDDKAQFYPLADAKIGHPAVVDLPGKTMVIQDGRFALNDGDAIRIVR